MAISVAFNGGSYQIPSAGQKTPNWANALNTYLQALAAGAAALSQPNTFTALQTLSAGAAVTGGLSADAITLPARALALGALAQGGAANGQALSWNGSAWAPTSGVGFGSVTSVGLAMPSIFSVSGSPITTAGTLTAAFTTQLANLVFAGPSSGSAAAPGFRALAAADIPTTLNATTFVTSATAPLFVATTTAAIAYLIGAATTSGVGLNSITSGKLAFRLGDNSGFATVQAATFDGNIISTTVPAFRNLGATGYGFGFADASHASVFTNNILALNIDSSQNAVFSAAVSAAGTLTASSGIVLPNTSKLTDTANGTVQITSSAGAFATLLLGASGSATGVQIVSSAATLTVNPGDGSANTNFTLTTGILKGRIVQATGFFESPNGSISQAAYGNTNGTSGLYFPTLTTAALSSNGVAAILADGSQNVGIGNTSPGSATPASPQTGISVIPANTATSSTMVVISGDISAQGGFRQTAGAWQSLSITASQTNVLMKAAGGAGTGNFVWCSPFSGSVVGIAVGDPIAGGSVTGGSVTFQVTKFGGVTTGLPALVWSSGTIASAMYTKDTYPIVANTFYYITYTTTGTYVASSSLSPLVTLFVEC